MKYTGREELKQYSSKTINGNIYDRMYYAKIDFFACARRIVFKL